MLIIHHNDIDGFASAAVVAKNYDYEPKMLRFYGMHHGMELPLIYNNEIVVIVDFAPSTTEEFDQIIKTAGDVFWIDHHQTSIEKHEKFNYLKGIRRVGTAACELCWEYFFTGHEMPEVIKLLGDYDVWKFAYGDRTKNFQSAARVLDMRPSNYDLWSSLFEGKIIDSMVTEGGLITKISQQNWNRSVRSIGHIAAYNGYMLVCCNVQGSSATFSSVKKDIFEIMAVYSHNGRTFKVTLYSREGGADVSVIAKKFGGGGHKHASGFFCEELPWVVRRRLEKEDFIY